MPNYWSPVEVLDLDDGYGSPDEYRCVGLKNDTGARCSVVKGPGDPEHGMIRSMVRVLSHTQLHRVSRDEISVFAGLLLCHQEHRKSQLSEVTSRWMDTIHEHVERSASRHTDRGGEEQSARRAAPDSWNVSRERMTQEQFLSRAVINVCVKLSGLSTTLGGIAANGNAAAAEERGLQSRYTGPYNLEFEEFMGALQEAAFVLETAQENADNCARKIHLLEEMGSELEISLAVERSKVTKLKSEKAEIKDKLKKVKRRNVVGL